MPDFFCINATCLDGTKFNEFSIQFTLNFTADSNDP